MAVELTIFPTHLLLSQTLLTGSQEIDYNPWLLEMSPVLAVTVWCAHLASAPLAGTCDESCSWQHKDLPQVVHLHRDQCIPDFLGNHWAGHTEHYPDQLRKSLKKDQ